MANPQKQLNLHVKVQPYYHSGMPSHQFCNTIKLDQVVEIVWQMLKFQSDASVPGMTFPGQQAGYGAGIDLAGLFERKNRLACIDCSNAG